jgi:hypothetical protein
VIFTTTVRKLHSKAVNRKAVSSAKKKADYPLNQLSSANSPHRYPLNAKSDIGFQFPGYFPPLLTPLMVHTRG